MVKRIIPGHDHSKELDAIKLEIRQLASVDMPDDEYDRRLAELRAERDRVNALPVTPGTVELVPTGDTYWQLWDALADAQRGPWLKSHGFRVTADKAEVRLTQPGIPGSSPRPGDSDRPRTGRRHKLTQYTAVPLDSPHGARDPGSPAHVRVTGLELPRPGTGGPDLDECKSITAEALCQSAARWVDPYCSSRGYWPWDEDDTSSRRSISAATASSE